MLERCLADCEERPASLAKKITAFLTVWKNAEFFLVSFFPVGKRLQNLFQRILSLAERLHNFFYALKISTMNFDTFLTSVLIQLQ
jgi:hypothetical protein